MKDKATIARNYILDLLEDGKLKAGDKLPGARSIANTIQISFMKVQQALDRLVQDGVLETIPRQGTFVQQNWDQRIIQSNFTVYEDLPWFDGFEKLLSESIPQLRLCRKFTQSVFELRTTLYAQSNNDDYLDLLPIFNRIYPDKSAFFSHPFKNFYVDGKLVGLAFIFSPRVMFFNPEILSKCGCPEPHPGWTWDEFIESVRKIRSCGIPGKKIFNWKPAIFQWINIIFRAGGCLISPSESTPVKIDHPRTRLGLKLYTELKKELDIDYDEACHTDYVEQFINGEQAFLLSEREILSSIKNAGFDSWQTVPLPMIEDGKDITAQATELICIRKNCTDLSLAEDFIRFMLSERVQDFIGGEKYGIPIRKSSAFKSINPESQRDVLFMSEISKITAQYNTRSAEMLSIIEGGINQIWSEGLDVDVTTRNIAEIVRLFIKIKQDSKNKKQYEESQMACPY